MTLLQETSANNAGFGLIDEHVALDAGRLHRMLQLNVAAVAELCHRYGGETKRRRAGRILNIASAAAYQSTPYFAAYGASKAFVQNPSEALAKELEDFGVSVSCLSKVVGAGARALVLVNRFAPRALVASVSKRLLGPHRNGPDSP